MPMLFFMLPLIFASTHFADIDLYKIVKRLSGQIDKVQGSGLRTEVINDGLAFAKELENLIKDLKAKPFEEVEELFQKDINLWVKFFELLGAYCKLIRSRFIEESSGNVGKILTHDEFVSQTADIFEGFEDEMTNFLGPIVVWAEIVIGRFMYNLLARG